MASTTTLAPRTGHRAGLPLAAAGGVLAGMAAKSADESGWRWAADLGSYPAAWVLAVALLGWSAPSLPAAAARAGAFFAAMTLGYYGWAAVVLHRGWQVDLVVVWLLLSATAVPAVAVAVRWATARAGVAPGALLALTAGVAVAGGFLPRQLQIWTGAQPYLLGHPVQAIADAAVAAVVVLLLPRHRRTRLWALVLLVPSGWLAGRLLGVLIPYTV